MGEWLSKVLPTWLYENNQFTVIGKIIFSTLIIIVSFFLIKLIIFLLKKAFGIKTKKGLQIDRSASYFIIQSIKVILWLFVSLIVIQILGLSIESFAGIISAITVALSLSLQDVIKCFASGIIIINQKHFVAGDFIELLTSNGKAEGMVQKVSLMSTTLKNANGQFIQISNTIVRESILTNYTRNGTRRIFYTVNVDYDSDFTLVKKTLLDIVNKDERTLKDPAPQAHFDKLGDFQVVAVIKFWVKYEDYWDVLNGLHEKILISFKKNKIVIPRNTNLKIENIKN